MMISGEIIWTGILPKQYSASPLPVNEVVFKPDGSQLLACVGVRILVYNVLDGQLLHSLRAHTDNVYSIAYSPDGTKFASGGKDKAVIVWSSSCKGIFRYEHSDSVQRVSFSPRGDKLASTTNSEIGFYCVETKQIDKYSTPAKSLAATWSADGEILTVGMINGLVSFRSANGHQIGSIRRSAPISCLLWITAESELSGGSHNKDDKLAIGCWDKSISFYSLSGERAEEDCALQSTPLSIVRFSPGTDSILISCTNGRISLCSTNGVLLRDIYSETSWIWSVAYHPEHALVALGDNEGRIRLCNHPAKFPHDFDNGIFISSINFTSITVETSEHAQRYTINARTLVYDVSYYKSNLAFATAAAIFLYNVSLPNESSTLCCAFKTKIKGAYKADRLLVAEDFIMVATCCKIQCYSFDSSPRDTWLFDSNVTSLCLVEGFYGKLSILAGLSDGKVYLIKHDPRPELIFEMGIKVTSLQLDTKCNLLGVLTDKEYVAFDWSSREISFRASNVSTFVFHDSLSRLAAYVVNGKLFACHGKKSVEIAEIHNDAILLSFSDKCVVFAREFISQLFNIHVLYESLVDAHLMEKDLESASQLALFLNNADKLNRIGLEAIGSMNFVLARQCFCLSGSEDLNKYICKVEDQFQRHVPKTDLQLLAFAEQGEIAGRLGLYSDAVAYFLKAKNPERAVQVLINKNLWDEARTLATSQGCVSKEFLDECEVDYYIREERWRDAVSLYLLCQKYTKAVDLIGKIKWEGWDVDLLELLKQLSLDNHWEAFQMCADLFRAANHVAQLKEVFLISRDYPALADLALQEGNRNDAILFFQKAGMKDELCETLELQAIEAARLDKFVDAALSYYRIEMQSYNNISSPSKCILFHGYQNVNDYCNNKLSLNIEPDAFVRLCMFQYNSLMKFDTPPSLISKSTVLLALAKQAVALGENEMARVALSELRPPYTPQNKRIKNEIQENLLLSKTPLGNDRQFAPRCFRCGAENPYLNMETDMRKRGDLCIHCLHPFVRCYLTYEILPFVEFIPVEFGEFDSSPRSIKHALEYFLNTNISKTFRESDSREDPIFNEALATSLESQKQSKDYNPIKISISNISKIDASTVFGLYYDDVKSTKFFKHILSDAVDVVTNQHTRSFFDAAMFRDAVRKNGGNCPITNQPVDIDNLQKLCNPFYQI